MTHYIEQKKLTDSSKEQIFYGLGEHSIETMGLNGLSEEPTSFEIHNDSEWVGAIVVQPFWGQLHIKYLFVGKKYRKQGFGRLLMEKALEFAKQRNYRFAFVETLSFQALGFYQKMGFVLEFSRPGYSNNVTFHYLKKDL